MIFRVMAATTGRLCLRVLRWLLSIFWCCFLLGMFTTWFDTVQLVHRKNGSQHMDSTGAVLSMIFLLAAFFLLAGVEIAYTDLRDKDPSQLKVVGPLLGDMQKQEDLLYESREWLGVILIVALVFLADFDAIQVPWLGERQWRLAFSLLFTTFPLVWLAQAPAKYFARQNSETFLARAGFAWPVFKGVGSLIRVLRLRVVSDLVLSPFANVSSRRNLPPSNAAFYVSSLKRYGYAMHDCLDRICISGDGSAKLTQDGLIYIVSPERQQLTRRHAFSSDIVGEATIEVLSVRDLAQPYERLGEIENQISGAMKCAPGLAAVDFKGEKLDSPTGKTIEFLLISRTANPRPDKALLVEYRTVVSCGAGAFSVERAQTEHHELHCTFPHHTYRAHLSIDPDAPQSFGNPRCKVTFQQNEHSSEGRRAKIEVERGGKALAFTIQHPLPGAVYRVEWDNW
jgi:hypothetical protein